MQKIVNGIVYDDSKKVFGLGAAYYASFHNKKMAVPPEGDQLGEMKKDIAAMKEAGFNIVRTSALGELHTGGGKVDFTLSPFIDEMLKTIEEHGLGAFVRLQGYSMKQEDYPDDAMINSEGEHYAGKKWANFLVDSIYHDRVLEDNYNGTKKIAQTLKDRKCITAFMTYNEPHYPDSGIYDYNEHAIKKYRKWLKENNIKLSDDLDSYVPPKHRPAAEERLEDWIYWRMFAIHSLSEFLNSTAKCSKQVNPDIQSLTCMTVNMVEFDNCIKGCDYFDISEGMDIFGLTLYKNAFGGDYYTTDLIINSAESAAAVSGKHAWLLELDAMTKIPMHQFNRETFMVLGSGYKGIVYYQWRGDYPFEKAPEPDLFGFVRYDGTKTENYDDKIKMLSMINEISDYAVNSEKHRSGAAILYSEYGAMYADASENVHEKTVGVRKNTYMSRLRRYYRELKQANVMADIVKAKNLKDNLIGVKVLFVPDFECLSDTEKAEIREFAADGGRVFVQSYDKWQKGLEKCGFDELDAPQDRYTACYEASEVLELAGIKPLFDFGGKYPLGANITEGDSYYMLTLTNISNIHDKLSNIEIRFNVNIDGADIYMPGFRSKAEVSDNCFTVPEIFDGAVIIVGKTDTGV